MGCVGGVKVGGVHHMAIGTRDLAVMRAFYEQEIRCTKTHAEWTDLSSPVPDFFRDQPHMLSAPMIMQEGGGIIVELVQIHSPAPRPIRGQTKLGDIGVNKLTISVPDVEEFVAVHRDRMSFASMPKRGTLPSVGEYAFVFARDPEGNLLEFVSHPGIVDERISCVGLGVTDLSRSIAFYREHLGYDTVVVPTHDRLSGLVDEVSGAEGTHVLSCVLANSGGGHMLELYEVSAPRGRSLPLDAMWGDLGMLEVAHECDDIAGLAEHFSATKIEFMHRLHSARIGGRAKGTYWFLYVRDPDGIPVEVIMEEWERE